MWRTKQQVARYKTQFAKRIADTIDLRGFMRQLFPDALATELFKKIGSKCPDGLITKEALWTFMSTGEDGEMNEFDFNALFAAMDLNNSGTVNYLEYCAFVGKCSGEYRSDRKRPISVAKKVASRLSSVSPTYVDKNKQDIQAALNFVAQEDKHTSATKAMEKGDKV